MTYEDFDDILADLKTGRWTWLHTGTFCLSLFVLPQLFMGGVFLAPITKGVCILPDSVVNSNLTVTECSYGYNSTDNGTKEEYNKCENWIFDEEPGNTLTSEFNLICDRSYLRPSYQSAFMLGTLFGAPINGFTADRFGRKGLHIFGITAFAIVTLVTTFFRSFSWILVCRLLSGLITPTITHTGLALTLELLEPKYRPSFFILYSVPWAMGTVWSGVLAYLIRDWRWLMRAFMLPFLIIWPLVWFYDESPRWLIVQGSLNRAQKILEKAFRMNRSELRPGNQLTLGIERIHELSIKEKRTTDPNKSTVAKVKQLLLKVTKLCRTPETRRRTFLMYFMHFVGSMIYFGLTLNAVNFKLNPYVYMMVTGAIEIPSYILSVPIIKKFGRVKPLVLSWLIVGVCVLILAFVSMDTEWIAITLSLIGKFTVSTSINIVFLLDSELLPTEVKVQIFGTAMVLSRIGSILAAFVTDLMNDVLPWLPAALFGCLSLASAGVACFVPETLNKHIYNTVLQLEEDTKLKKRRKKVKNSAKNGGLEELRSLEHTTLSEQEKHITSLS